MQNMQQRQQQRVVFVMTFWIFVFLVMVVENATCKLSYKKPLVWGLDFGNDNCVAAIAGREGVDVVMNDISERQTPSAVYFSGDMRLVGESTTSQSSSAPSNLVNNIKMLIANSLDTIRNYVIREDKEKRRRVAVVSHMREELELETSELVGMIMAHMNRIVETSGQGRSSSFVCGVPSDFTRKQRLAILDGATIQRSAEHSHGLPLHGMVDEGVAIALCYGMLKKGPLGAEGSTEKPSVVAFVDIGHTCTQVTVTSYNGRGLAVLGRACKRGCGVSSLEKCLFDHVVDGVAKAKGVVVRGAARPTHRLLASISKLVKMLSANVEAQLSVECIDGEVDIQTNIARTDLERLAQDSAQAVEDTCSDALLAAGLEPAQVTSVELLGGGSYVPMFQRAVEKVFGAEKVCRTISSAESIAKGCALAAAQQSTLFRLKPFQLTDKLPPSLPLTMTYQLMETTTAAESRSQSSQGKDGSDNESDSGGASRKGVGRISWAAGTPIPFVDKVLVTVEPSRVESSEENSVWEVVVDLIDDVSGETVSSYVCHGKGVGSKARRYLKEHSQAHVVDAHVIIDVAMDISGEALVSGATLEIDIEEVKQQVPLPPPPSSSSSSSEPSTTTTTTGSTAAAFTTASSAPDSGSPSESDHSGGGSNSESVHVHMFSDVLAVKKTYSNTIQGQRLEAALSKEAKLAARDQVARDASEARNALEDQVYAVRGQLADGSGELARFTTQAEAESILALLDDLEDWIYDSSSASSSADGQKGKQAFQIKSVQLQSKLQAPLERKRCFESVHNALDDLDQALLIREKEYRDRQDVMKSADIRKCDKELASLQHWLAQMRNNLEELENGPSRNGSSDKTTIPSSSRPVYGRLAGKLPCTPQQAQKRLEQLIELAKSLEKYRGGHGSAADADTNTDESNSSSSGRSSDIVDSDDNDSKSGDVAW